MALTFVKIRVINPARPKKNVECKLLVDSGALYSAIPAHVLKQLGIKPTSSEEFILANGEVISKDIGNAFFEFRGKIRAAPVIFADKEVFLLGATTLEAMGFVLDPMKRELKPLPLHLM